MPAAPTVTPIRRARRGAQQPESFDDLRRDLEDLPPLDTALEIVGDRWSLAVVAQLTRGPQRFNQLAEACAPIARTVLSDRLRKLEIAGVLARRKYSDAPARYDYRLTVSGAELAKAAAILSDWASRHLGNGQPILRHDECGGEVTPAYRCLTCGPVSPRTVHTSMLQPPRNQG